MEHFKTNRGKPNLEKTRNQTGKFVEMREKKTCKARFRTYLEDTMIFGGMFDQDHVEEEDRTIERQTLRKTCKQKAI